MSSGERPIGAAKGTQSDTEALCHPPPPSNWLLMIPKTPWPCALVWRCVPGPAPKEERCPWDFLSVSGPMSHHGL